MPEIANSQITAAIAKALFGERANRCQELMLILRPEELPQVMASFLLTAEEGQGVADAINSVAFHLVEQNAIEFDQFDPAAADLIEVVTPPAAPEAE